MIFLPEPLRLPVIMYPSLYKHSVYDQLVQITPLDQSHLYPLAKKRMTKLHPSGSFILCDMSSARNMHTLLTHTWLNQNSLWIKNRTHQCRSSYAA